QLLATRHVACLTPSIRPHPGLESISMQGVQLLTRKSSLAIMLLLSLLLPLLGMFLPASKAQTNAPKVAGKKMTEDLLARSHHSRAGSGERTRVILNVVDAASADRART